MGAPVGNQNASNVKVWSDAIKRAMARAEHDPYVGHRTLNALADRLLEKAAEGDMAALKELGDRLEGKPTQLIAGDADAAPIQAAVRVIFGRD